MSQNDKINNEDLIAMNVEYALEGYNDTSGAILEGKKSTELLYAESDATYLKANIYLILILTKIVV